MDQREKQKVFKTVHCKLGASSIKGTLSFSVAAERRVEGAMEEETQLSMMIAYSSETIYVYELANPEARDAREMGLKFKCSQRIHGMVLSVTNFAGEEGGRPIFLVLLEEGRVTSLTYNPKLDILETFALHRLDNKESQSMLRNSPSKPTPPILKIDKGRV